MNNTATASPSRLLAMLGLILAVLFWAGNSIVARVSADLIPPVSLNFYRWVISLSLILPFTYQTVWKFRHELLPHWRYLCMQALFSIAMFNSLQYLAAHTTSAININLVNSMNPVFTFLMSWILLRQASGKMQIAGLLIALCGLMVTVSGGTWHNFIALSFNVGDLWMLLAVICWAIYSVMLRRSPLKMPPFAFLTVMIIIGIVLQIPLYAYEYTTYGGFSLGQKELLILAYVGIFPSLGSFSFWMIGVNTLGANVSSMFLYLAPPIAAVLAWFFLQETLGWHHLVGEILILAGFLLTVLVPSILEKRKALSS